MKQPAEFKIVALRECPLPAKMAIYEQPDHALAYGQKAHCDGGVRHKCELDALLRADPTVWTVRDKTSARSWLFPCR